MSDSHTSIASLDSALNDGWLILTPSHRTAVQTHESLLQLRKASGQELVTQSPAIHAIDIWLQELFDSCFHDSDKLPACTVLESYQELALWKRIIRESEDTNPLLNLENAARNVLEAQRLMTLWQIPDARLKAFRLDSRTTDFLDDSAAFAHWSASYRRYCRRHHLMSFSERLQQVLPILTECPGILPPKIVLLGFSKPPPLYESLFSLFDRYCELQRLDWEPWTPDLQLRSFADSASELRNCVRWSRDILNREPDAKIGIISTQLNEQLPYLKRLLQADFSEAGQQTLPYFIASGAEAALDLPLLMEIPALLQFNLEELSALQACRLLRSPLLPGQEEESRSRAELEFRLRRNGSYMIRTAYLRTLLAQDQRSWHCPALQQALQDFENLKRQQKRRQPLYQWADLFSRQLSVLVWADESGSVLKPYVDAALEKLKKLDFIGHDTSLEGALEQFESSLNSIQNPENRQEAPIQVVNPRDALGMRFTHLWFLGLSDLQWPENRYANPFIPFTLQREYGLPDSSAEEIYLQAGDTLQELRGNTEKVFVCSYPRRNDNGSLQISPILSQFCSGLTPLEQPAEDLSTSLQPASVDYFFQSRKKTAMQVVEEEAFYPLLADESPHGGVSLIGNQAECPFRAFAINRLDAVELAPLDYAIPAYDLGSMLHQILEHFWRRLKTQKAFLQMSAENISRLIEEACDSGLDSLQKKHPLLVQKNYRLIEKRRLSALLQRWLEHEKQRGSFEVVENEFKVEWRHAELSLQFRIDRIDKTEDGFVLIDYKSGRKAGNSWDDPRPSTPQLMLYADALQQQNILQPLSALLYARINIEQTAYSGLSAGPGIYPGTALAENRQLNTSFSWPELTAFWSLSLQNLAQEFLSGYAAVKPKGPEACRYCHLDAFCRIQEQADD